MCFFLGVNLLITGAALVLPNVGWFMAKAGYAKCILSGNISDMPKFQYYSANIFHTAATAVSGRSAYEGYLYTPAPTDVLIQPDADTDAAADAAYRASLRAAARASLDNDLLYKDNPHFWVYAENRTEHAVYTNGDADTALAADGTITPPEGFRLVLLWNGERLTGDSDFLKNFRAYYTSAYDDIVFNGALSGCTVAVAVANDIDTAVTQYMSRVYSLRSELREIRAIALCAAGLVVLTLTLLATALVRRRDKREFDRRAARVTGFFFVEIKLVAALLIGMWMISALIYLLRDYGYDLDMLVILVACMWAVYFFINDIVYHKREWYRNNIVNYILRRYRRHEMQKPFQRALISRLNALVAAEVVLVFLSGLFFLLAVTGGGFPVFLIGLLPLGIGVFLLIRYLDLYHRLVTDLGLIVDYIAAMKTDTITAPLSLSPDSDFRQAAENLNTIQAGMEIAVAERLKSERMKIELITNVSHDIKTPLTSIISYVDLLSKIEGLPEEVNDYIRILRAKSERLKNMVQDIFEVSKATSGNLNVTMEELDLAKLMRQTVADMDEQIAASTLHFKLAIPDTSVHIRADGTKLYRVFQNVITNALRYSMEHTRVYLSLESDGERATARIKNVSAYDLTELSYDITERFVRGDSSRTSEGSGLGLSIAKSFTEACGGTFAIQLDADLFTAEVTFPVTMPQPEPPAADGGEPQEE